jgi:hypothetical protein
MLTDVYGHVMIDPTGDEWQAFWLSAYDPRKGPRAVERSRGVVPVWSGEGSSD